MWKPKVFFTIPLPKQVSTQEQLTITCISRKLKFANHENKKFFDYHENKRFFDYHENKRFFDYHENKRFFRLSQ